MLFVYIPLKVRRCLITSLHSFLRNHLGNSGVSLESDIFERMHFSGSDIVKFDNNAALLM